MDVVKRVFCGRLSCVHCVKIVNWKTGGAVYVCDNSLGGNSNGACICYKKRTEISGSIQSHGQTHFTNQGRWFSGGSK